jgi:hypothetical protein
MTIALSLINKINNFQIVCATKQLLNKTKNFSYQIENFSQQELKNVYKKYIYSKPDSNKILSETNKLFEQLLHSPDSGNVKFKKVAAHLKKILKDPTIALNANEQKLFEKVIEKFKNKNITLSDKPLLEQTLTIIQEKFFGEMGYAQRILHCYGKYLTGQEKPYQVTKGVETIDATPPLFPLRTKVASTPSDSTHKQRSPTTPKAPQHPKNTTSVAKGIIPIELLEVPDVSLKDIPSLFQKELATSKRNITSFVVSTLLLNGLLRKELPLTEIIFSINQSRDKSKTHIKTAILSEANSCVEKAIIHVLFPIVHAIVSFYLSNLFKTVENLILQIEYQSKEEMKNSLFCIINGINDIIKGIATKDIPTLNKYIKAISLLITTKDIKASEKTIKKAKWSLKYMAIAKITKIIAENVLFNCMQYVQELPQSQQQILAQENNTDSELHLEISSLIKKLVAIQTKKPSLLATNAISCITSWIFSSFLLTPCLSAFTTPNFTNLGTHYISSVSSPILKSGIAPMTKGADGPMINAIAKLYFSKERTATLVHFIYQQKQNIQYGCYKALKELNQALNAQRKKDLNLWRQEIGERTATLATKYLMKIQRNGNPQNYVESVIDEIQDAVENYLQSPSEASLEILKPKIEEFLKTDSFLDPASCHNIAKIEQSFKDLFKNQDVNAALENWAEELNFFTFSTPASLSLITKQVARSAINLLPLNAINAYITSIIRECFMDALNWY